MCVRNVAKTLIFLAILAFLGGCDATDSFLSSGSAYRPNAQINGIPLTECSFVALGDSVHPYFEEPVSNDPDVTALMVFLRNPRGELAGEKVLYSLDGEAEKDETVILVQSLDGELPSFPIPSNLPYGRYTMVSQIMSGKDILQKTEKPFFYLSNAVFSFESINAHLPGIIENPQLISTGCVVMLEAKVDFDSRLDPYIIWYDGRKKISEGRFSEGAGSIFWKAPEQSGFFFIRAEIFPIDGYEDLAGYYKEVSLLVSSKMTDINLVSEDIPQLAHWYIFDGSLNDSKMITSAERALKSLSSDRPRWMSANGIYGLATGRDNVIAFPNVLVSNNGHETWQTLFRFKPLNEGVIFSVLFGASSDVSLSLKTESQYLVLTLSSPLKTVSQVLKLPEQESFLVAGVSLSILPGLLSARINVMGDSVEQGELAVEPVYIEAELGDIFQILLGDSAAAGESVNHRMSLLTALWDEFAVYNTPPMEIIAAEVRQTAVYTQPELN
jgi:hypothetical protein